MSTEFFLDKMIKLIVVRNLIEFLRASNIEYKLEYCSIKTKYGSVIAVTVDKYLCTLTMMNPNKPVDALDAVKNMYPNAEYKEVKDLNQSVNIDFDNFENSDVVILAQGTEFQEKVWRALLEIPAGKTMFYSEIAQKIGSPAAVRACGSAVGKNPVAMLIPCHRVIGRNGHELKFASGPENKRCLLQYEGVTV